MTADLDRMKRRQARLAQQLAKLDEQIKTGSGVYTTETKENTINVTYTRKTPLVRWQLAECILCGKPGTATRYPGHPPTICDTCYNGERIAGDSARAREDAKAARKRRERDGQPLPPPAERLSSDE